MQQPITVVLGMHRSGTSLCGNLLHALGIDMAEDPGAAPSNRRGHWERSRLVGLNDRVFAMFGRGWTENTHALALPGGWWLDPGVEDVRREIVRWMAPRLRSGVRFGFKDPRTARLMPMWRAVFAELGVAPQFVFCVRDPAQVTRSLTARDRMAREQAEYRWAMYNADAIAGIGGDPVCIIPYESWFTAPEETLARLANFVDIPVAGAGWLGGIVADTVDAELRHDGETEADARAISRRLHRSILQCVPDSCFAPDLRAFAAMLGEFIDLVQPMLLGAEILRVSVSEQNRVIGDLNGLVARLRQAA